MPRLDISQGHIGVVWGDRERIYSIPAAGQGRVGVMASPGNQLMGYWLWAGEDGVVEDVQ